jgi:hypothetical protein
MPLSTTRSFSTVFRAVAVPPRIARPFLVSFLQSHNFIVGLATLLLATGGLALSGSGAIAQVTINRDSATGSVDIDRNAFDIRTGPLTNTSNVPLPSELPTRIIEGVAVPVETPRLAPNSIDIRNDFDYINQSFNDSLNQGQGSNGLNYNLQRESLRTTTDFELRYIPGQHNFGEGIRVTVRDAGGNVVSSETRFVRGDAVTIGSDGQTLNSEEKISVTYGVDETVELRVLNLQEDRSAPQESGVYFTRDGQIIAEDLPDGGDKDFDDGEYVSAPEGEGAGIALEENRNITVTNRQEENPLDPTTRQEESVESDTETVVSRDEQVIELSREWGSVETPDSNATRLGHAVGAQTEAGDLLIYDRYAAAGQVRAGTDGVSLIGQLPPLFRNPSAPPTLLTGSAAFDPFADDNEAGFTTSLGITQFLSRTHREARDVFGNVIENPDPDGPRLLEPTGLFSNRRLVGYVPDETVIGDQLSSANGVFSLPGDQEIVIEPPVSQSVGRGNAAYTDNVGGLLVESSSGAFTFIPQWTREGFAQEPITLAPGEAERIIYALVPQQSGQNLRLGQTYAVNSSGTSYRIADGGFNIISADRQPENFLEETAEVYAVEDTLASGNASTPLFNGIRGVYLEPSSRDRVPTVDVNLRPEADARVGNTLFPVEEIPGQPAYARTTRAAGLYLAASLTGGIGNQRDVVQELTISEDIARDELRTTTTTRTFTTPQVQLNTTPIETTTTTQRQGEATFDINTNGLLENVNFRPTSDPVVVDTSSRDLDTQSEVRLGEEVLSDTEVEQDVQVLNERVIARDEESNTREDSYANASPVQGEIALGGVLNMGNTPWTPAANTLRAELFARDAVFGRSADGSEAGWRAELMLHPFGEVRREAFQYDESGELVALYETEPVLDENGDQVVETVTAEDGSTVELPVNQFVTDEAGNRVAQRVGTGRTKGPGVYVRVEDAWDDDDSAVVDGGLQFSF